VRPWYKRRSARGATSPRKGPCPPIEPYEGCEPSFSLNGADSRHAVKGDSYVRRPRFTTPSQP
jgi:hypothetical protein